MKKKDGLKRNRIVAKKKKMWRNEEKNEVNKEKIKIKEWTEKQKDEIKNNWKRKKEVRNDKKT